MNYQEILEALSKEQYCTYVEYENGNTEDIDIDFHEEMIEDFFALSKYFEKHENMEYAIAEKVKEKSFLWLSSELSDFAYNYYSR